MKDKKHVQPIQRFAWRSLLMLSALTVLSAALPSASFMPTADARTEVRQDRSTADRDTAPRRSSGGDRQHLSTALGSILQQPLTTLGLLPLTAYAASWPTPDFSVESEGAILIDADSGAVLYEKNATTAYYPASITKVLTAIIVLENCTNLEDKVTFSNAAVNTNLEENSTVIGAIAGDKLSVRDCLYGLLLQSANDCANALAEYIAGSNEKFAELMNQKAAELGCVNSHFANPSGLNNPEHYTCAADYAKIMQYAIQNETFRAIDATQVYTHAPISKYPNEDAPENTIYAHHHMMRRSFSEYYPGVFAGKTGYTTLAGNTLVTACERDGMTLICVILNGHNSQYRDTKNLFDFGYNSFQSLSVGTADDSFQELASNLKVDGIPLVNTLEFTIDDGDHVTLPKSESFDSVTRSLSYDLSDQEKTEGAFARVDYSMDGRSLGKAYVRLTDESEEKAAAAQDAAVMESKVQETIPETIHLSEGTEAAAQPTVAGQLPQETSAQHAPIVLNREKGRIELPKPILRVLVILAIIALIAGLVFGIYYLLERREEFLRSRRRKRMLKHTRDLTREQKARRDMMLNSRTGRRKRKK